MNLLYQVLPVFKNINILFRTFILLKRFILFYLDACYTTVSWTITPEPTRPTPKSKKSKTFILLKTIILKKIYHYEMSCNN